MRLPFRRRFGRNRQLRGRRDRDAGRAIVDASVWQVATKLGESGFGHQGVGEINEAKVRHAAEVNETGVGDLCSAETERPQLGQGIQLREAGVGDLGPGKEEAAQAGKPGQGRQARVRHLRLVKIEVAQLAGRGYVRDSSICDAGTTKAQCTRACQASSGQRGRRWPPQNR